MVENVKYRNEIDQKPKCSNAMFITVCACLVASKFPPAFIKCTALFCFKFFGRVLILKLLIMSEKKKFIDNQIKKKSTVEKLNDLNSLFRSLSIVVSRLSEFGIELNIEIVTKELFSVGKCEVKKCLNEAINLADAEMLKSKSLWKSERGRKK